jgi:transcription-repair coupling factor (superfamily II helicase)
MEAVGFELYTRMLAEAVDVRRGRVVGVEPAAVRLDLPGSAYLPDAYVGDSGAKLEMYRRFAAIRSDGDAEQLRGELRDRFGPIPEPVEGLFRAVAVRLAAEAAHVPEVRAESRGVTLKWPRYDRHAVSVALSTAGFRPTLASNQVRIPVAAGRDPVDVAVRALTALTTAR